MKIVENKSYPECSALFIDSGGGWLPDMVRPGSPQEESSFVFFRDPVFSLSSLGQGVSVRLQDRKLNFNRDPLSVLEGYLSEGCRTCLGRVASRAYRYKA